MEEPGAVVPDLVVTDLVGVLSNGWRRAACFFSLSRSSWGSALYSSHFRLTACCSAGATFFKVLYFSLATLRSSGASRAHSFMLRCMLACSVGDMAG
jgi:hypothetical protein